MVFETTCKGIFAQRAVKSWFNPAKEPTIKQLYECNEVATTNIHFMFLQKSGESDSVHKLQDNKAYMELQSSQIYYSA